MLGMLTRWREVVNEPGSAFVRRNSRNGGRSRPGTPPALAWAAWCGEAGDGEVEAP